LNSLVRDLMFPSLVVGMSPLHRPGAGISPAAIVALASIVDRGHPTGFLAADRAYTHAVHDDFQLPARALGYDLVLDYRTDQLGVRDSYAGALQIEGAWFCPAIPNRLKTATIDYRARRIDETLWRQLIEARRDYRLRRKGKPDASGHVRLMSPAGGAAPIVRCDLKPGSSNRAGRGKTRIVETDALGANPPQICAQESLTVPPEAGAKLAQTLLYGSPEWERTYHGLRNTVEGMNASSRTAPALRSAIQPGGASGESPRKASSSLSC
jgi:hypothetical protein